MWLRFAGFAGAAVNRISPDPWHCPRVKYWDRGCRFHGSSGGSKDPNAKHAVSRIVPASKTSAANLTRIPAAIMGLTLMIVPVESRNESTDGFCRVDAYNNEEGGVRNDAKVAAEIVG